MLAGLAYLLSALAAADIVAVIVHVQSLLDNHLSSLTDTRLSHKFLLWQWTLPRSSHRAAVSLLASLPALTFRIGLLLPDLLHALLLQEFIGKLHEHLFEIQGTQCLGDRPLVQQLNLLLMWPVVFRLTCWLPRLLWFTSSSLYYPVWVLRATGLVLFKSLVAYS